MGIIYEQNKNLNTEAYMNLICIYAHDFKTKKIKTDNSKTYHWTRTCFNCTHLPFSQLHINIIVNLTYLYGTTTNRLHVLAQSPRI